MLTFPKNLEVALLAYAKALYMADTRKKDFAARAFTFGDFRFFAKGVAELHRSFTSERSYLPKNYFNRKEMRSGYLVYFFPVNALKIAGLLGQIPETFFQKPLRVLDLGSGPGSGILGTWLRQPKARLEAVMVDQNPSVLREGSQFLQQLAEKQLLPGRLNLQTRVAELHRPGLGLKHGETFDLIILANVLNEWENPDLRLKGLQALLRNNLSPNGRVLIAEPALRHPTRELMKLRDLLLEREIGHVYAPCLHQKNCPMLAANPRDWCHTYLEWKRPEFINQFDRLAEIRKEYLKASYLILGQEPAPASPELWRVVSGPLNSKGKTERLLCGEKSLPHLNRLMVQDKDRSPHATAVRHWQRGDEVRLEKSTVPTSGLPRAATGSQKQRGNPADVW